MSHRTTNSSVVFFYLLLRDELPSGTVERLIADAIKRQATRNPCNADLGMTDEHELSCEHIAALAEDMCRRLGIEIW